MNHRERERVALEKWRGITDPNELIEAVEGIRKKTDLGPVKIEIPRNRINVFEEDGRISAEVAQELREHLDSLTEKKK